MTRYRSAEDADRQEPVSTKKRRAVEGKPSTASRRKKQRRGGDYFPEERERRRFIPTGSTLLDCILGGHGWVLGRVANIVGDRSTGKTLVAIETCANFSRMYPTGKIYYREAENAFDLPYAARLGLPVDRVDFGPDGIDSYWRTIESIFEDLDAVITRHAKSGDPALYIIDSLDALSSEAALSRKITDGSYNLEKQRILGQLFERMISGFRQANICLIIISQVRDKIGFTVGEKHRRSGGRSLDFYASHIVWLNHMKTLNSTIRGEKRATGIRVQAKCKKNKVGEPFRSCVFPIRFGFGIDDVEASVDWLVEHRMEDRIGIVPLKTKENSKGSISKAVDAFFEEMSTLSPSEYNKRASQIREVTIQCWREIEGWFKPQFQKYR